MPYYITWTGWGDETKSRDEIADEVFYEDRATVLRLEGESPNTGAANASTAPPPKMGWIGRLFGRGRGVTNASIEPAPQSNDLTYRPDSRTVAMLSELVGVLRELAIDSVEISYNGGNDEGFAEFESGSRGSESLEEADIRELLAASRIGERGVEPYEFGEDREQTPPDSTRTRDDIASNWLDAFATETAAILHGCGWGIGEYCLAGRFRVDLVTGVIEDLELDDPPDFVDELEWLWNDDEEED